MRHGTSVTIATILLTGLLLSVVIQVWALPATVKSVIEVFPEVTLLAVPAIIWGVLAVGCWQGVAVIGLRLVVLARNQEFDASAYGWLRASMGFLIAFIVLAVSAFIALSVLGYATPGAMLGLIASGLAALVITGALGLLLGTRPLLRQYSSS